jgi:hypothetical protein
VVGAVLGDSTQRSRSCPILPFMIEPSPQSAARIKVVAYYKFCYGSSRGTAAQKRTQLINRAGPDRRKEPT